MARWLDRICSYALKFTTLKGYSQSWLSSSFNLKSHSVWQLAAFHNLSGAYKLCGAFRSAWSIVKSVILGRARWKRVFLCGERSHEPSWPQNLRHAKCPSQLARPRSEEQGLAQWWNLKTSFIHASVSGWSAWPSVALGAFLAASLSFSSLISLNFLMFSKKSGLLCKVMKSLAFLLSPFCPCTVMVLVLISLKVAYWFLRDTNGQRY